MLQDGCGELVPVGDARALGAALARLARDPEERARIGARARRRVLERWGTDTVMREYRALYAELVRGARPRRAP
jgi:glycosyltransferase involved in cell wall biosynthesis